MSTRLAIVHASIDLVRSQACRLSWVEQAAGPVGLYTVQNGMDDTLGDDPRWIEDRSQPEALRALYVTKAILGVVPAYAIGVQKALEDGCDIICCLHDDLLCEPTQGVPWDEMVRTAFKNPRVGLVGFGGALGLGSGDIYQTPYNPMQLARQTFGSHMRDAAAHGQRWNAARRVACLDGFSQVGRREFWQGRMPSALGTRTNHGAMRIQPAANLFDLMARAGVRHHFYDGALGCYAKRLGNWEVWYLPVAVHHYGGQTAVGDARYAEWARTQSTGMPGTEEYHYGDAGFWHFAHQWGYNEFRDCLPLRVP